MKKCTLCKNRKALSEFYKDAYRGDGLMTRCKSCDIFYRQAKRIKNPNTYKLRDSRYYQRNKVRKKIYLEGWRKKNKQKIKCHTAVKIALLKGSLVKQPCEKCAAKAEAHHDDYTKPLDVKWFCRRHHAREHVKLNP